MITLYRRHLKACKHTSRKKEKCSCPIWAEGTVRGQKVRKSLDLRSMEAAVRLTREWEIHGPGNTLKVRVATARFVADAKARLQPSSVLKYEQSVKALNEALGDKTLREVTVDNIRALREAWEIAPITMQKRLETIRAFFNFCISSGWTEENPANAVEGPTPKQVPTMPFDDAEMTKIFDALETKYLEAHPQSTDLMKRKIKAFILVMLYSGVRISDCVFLKKTEIQDGRLFLYTHKTKVPVKVPLPEEVLKALKDVEGEFYFSTGRGTVKTWTTEWEERLKKVFVLAELPEAHSHMLRDTFATRLLVKGVPIEAVAALLGNTVKVVEKHYNPWVHVRQGALEESVRKTWVTSLPESPGSSAAA